MKLELHRELESILNRTCSENESNTPDFILATYLMECLTTFHNAIKARDRWYGVHISHGNSYFEKVKP